MGQQNILMNDIQHLPDQQRFTLAVGDSVAVLEYRLFALHDGTKAVDFSSTWVPPVLRSQGLAERLVREALRWAKEEGLSVHASCWYAAKFLRR